VALEVQSLQSSDSPVRSRSGRRATAALLAAGLVGLTLALAPPGADAGGKSRRHHGHGHHRSHHFHHYRPFVVHRLWIGDPFYDPFYDPWYGWYGYGYRPYPYRWPYYTRPYTTRRYDPWLHERRDYVQPEATDEGLPPGWQALAEGRDQEALLVFRSLSEDAPYHALPKVGYAIAAAALGDTHQSIWAMRRAFQTDPDSVRDAPLDDALRERLRGLAQELEPKPSYDYGTSDDYFLLAAIHYLSDDLSEASRAIERAVQKADVSASTHNLRRLIREAGQAPEPA
jgi:hypothetical protein